MYLTPQSFNPFFTFFRIAKKTTSSPYYERQVLRSSTPVQLSVSPFEGGQGDEFFQQYFVVTIKISDRPKHKTKRHQQSLCNWWRLLYPPINIGITYGKLLEFSLQSNLDPILG